MKGNIFSVRSFGGALFVLRVLEVDIYRVAFIGHGEIDDIRYVEDAIQEIAKGLLRTYEYVDFYVGRNGDFDISVASAIKRAQKSNDNSNSSLIVVLPYTVKDEYFLEQFYDEIYYPLDHKTHFKEAITKRNRWMIDNADLLICYVEEGRYGGAMTTLKYAQNSRIRIINLAEKGDENGYRRFL